MIDVRLYAGFIALYVTVGALMEGRYVLAYASACLTFIYTIQYIITLKPQPFLQQNSI